MKRLFVFLLTLILACLILPKIAMATSPDQYVQQVLQKDVPQGLRWIKKMARTQGLAQAEVYSLYQSVLPEAQGNQQAGISVKGSLDRMLLLLEGARYFEQVQLASDDFKNKKEAMVRVLQTIKDQTDRFQFGEDPQVLLELWPGADVGDGEKFSADMLDVFTQLQKILTQPVLTVVEQKVDAEAAVEAVATNEEAAPAENFEGQRFASYIESAESGKVAEECQGAKVWQTDQAESCQSDDTLECDRSYARQCKKLQ
jgi:hypothetical protein